MEKFKVKLILYTYRGTNEHPIYLRVYIDGKTTYKATGFEVSKELWDKPNESVRPAHKLASHINSEITLKKNNLIKEIIEQGISGKVITAQSVKLSITGKSLNNIFNFVEQYKLDVVNKRKGGTLKNYTVILKKLEDFHGSTNLSFEQITPAYLLKLENWLRGSVGGNYTHKILTILRSFFNAAIKKKLITYYPFDEYEFPAYISPVKDYLTMAELTAWEKNIGKIKNPYYKQTAVYFLFGCYSGLRVGDWYRFNKSNIEGNRIRLTTEKTGSSVSMLVSKPLGRMLKIMEKLKLDHPEQKVNEKLKDIAGDLKIKKHITCHTARHTFGITICLANKISSETAAELMGITLKTFVENYSQVNDIKIDRETKAAWAALK